MEAFERAGFKQLELNERLSIGDILRLLSWDKKAVDGAARFVLLEQIGHATPGHPVPEAAIRRALERQRDAVTTMTEKPPLWADLLLTLWVLVVAVFFFGVYFVPAIGLYTDSDRGGLLHADGAGLRRHPGRQLPAPQRRAQAGHRKRRTRARKKRKTR